MSGVNGSPLRNVAWIIKHVFDGGRSRQAIYRDVRADRIPHVYIGRNVFFDEDAVWASLRPDAGPAPAPEPAGPACPLCGRSGDAPLPEAAQLVGKVIRSLQEGTE